MDDVAQRQRIERSEVLSLGLGVCMMQTPSGQQEHYVLDSTLVPFWLATMDASRLRDDVRPKVVYFQRIAADVLARYFLGGDGAARHELSMLGVAVYLSWRDAQDLGGVGCRKPCFIVHGAAL